MRARRRVATSGDREPAFANRRPPARCSRRDGRPDEEAQTRADGETRSGPRRRPRARRAPRAGSARPRGRPSPLEVTTAALVEATARAGGCPACGGEVRVDDHAAETVDGRLLRAVRLACVLRRAHRALGRRPSLPAQLRPSWPARPTRLHGRLCKAAPGAPGATGSSCAAGRPAGRRLRQGDGHAREDDGAAVRRGGAEALPDGAEAVVHRTTSPRRAPDEAPPAVAGG